MRTVFLLTVCLLGCFAACSTLARDIPRERRKARWKKRRLIFNDDGTQCRTLNAQEVKERVYYPVNPNTCEHTHENFLALRTRPLLGSQVDTLVYCTGVFNHYHHHSDETELLKFAGNNSPDWAWELGTKGDDTLATVVKFCRTNSLEVFWSFRMNDSHDSYLPAMRPKWKDEHPELLMGKTKGSSRWSLLDYEKPAVRDKVLAILQDVLDRYDIDGVELDFFRHPAFFKAHLDGKPVTDEHRSLMTDLMRRLRRTADAAGKKRGRPMLVMIRVPDSVAYSKSIGLDLATWCEEGLIDILVGGGYFVFEPWENVVKFGHDHDVPVYPCLSGSRIGYGDGKGIRGNIVGRWRGEAASAWKAGADGIYLFNTAHDPTSVIYKELGSPDTMQDVPPLLTPGHLDPDFVVDGTKYIKLR